MAMWNPYGWTPYGPEGHNGCCMHEYPMTMQRMPQYLTLADRLFDTLDSMFEVPSSWLVEPPKDRQQQIQQQQTQQQQQTEMLNSNDKFMITLNVKEFKPEQLSVKCIKDRFLLIRGQSDVERDTDEGKKIITKEFARTFVIPKDVDIGNLKSNLSKEGVLTIEAPKKTMQTAPEERVISIEQAK